MDIVHSEKRFPLKRHQILLFTNLFFWISFAIFDILTSGGMLNGYYSAMAIRFLLHAVLFAGLIYPNLNILYPIFWSRRKYIEYAVAAFILLAINIYLRTQLDLFLIHSDRPVGIFSLIYESGRASRAMATLIESGFYDPVNGFQTSYYVGITIGSLGVFFITTPIRLVEDWFEKHELEVQLLKKIIEKNQAAAKTREEKLKFLKAQTDPHFLINAISSVYHLALIGSNQIDYALLRLSELMSYLLGYGKEDFIELKNEIHFIENYIDFNNTVHQEEFTVHFHHNATPGQMEAIRIPPMLLQPFFENAFKYNHEAPIESALTLQGNRLLFTIKNAFKPSKSIPAHSSSHSIGIQNVRERLEVFLPNRYELQFKVTESVFRVELMLYLNLEDPLNKAPRNESVSGI